MQLIEWQTFPVPGGEVRYGDAQHKPTIVKPARLMWTDPPYGTGKKMSGKTGEYYDYSDFGYVLDGIRNWLPVMADDGTVCICCDYRLAADAIQMMRREGWVYKGEIVWEFGLGRPRTSWWPVRHNSVLTFDQKGGGLFDKSAVPRTKRLSPGKGYNGDKPSGSVWEFTMSNTDPQRIGYPNQKPLALVEPFIRAHTLPGDLVVDPFAGSGTTGAAARLHGREFHMVDMNPDAITVMLERLQ